MSLIILGLGPGSIDDLSRRAWAALEGAAVVYLRTAQHPCVPRLPQAAVYHACDDLYEAHDDFSAVYEAICERVLTAVRSQSTGSVVYAVPGDPMVAEATVQRLLVNARAEGIAVTIINGISFIEPALALVGADAIAGLQVFDAITIAGAHHPPLNPDYPALLGQVYSRALAADLKLTLMNEYPDDFRVTLIHRAGGDDAIAETVPLHAIDGDERIEHLTALYVPALTVRGGFPSFQETIAHLRAPEGCPWDREQTHESLKPYLIEEAYEVLDAIDAGDPAALADELGDLLLQVVLHTQIAIDDGEFAMPDVIASINRKMIRRHPHVWGDVTVAGTGQVLTNWDAIKRQEAADAGKPTPESLLDGVPKSLPALMQATKYQKKAAKVGFDWNTADGVIAKVREEFDEVLTATDDNHRHEEFGDLLFVVVNWARFMGIDAEDALRAANRKFYRRFHYIEQALAARGTTMRDSTLEVMDGLWNEAKAQGL